MNTGQMMLTLGALMLISLTILNFNINLADIDDSLNDNRFRLEALSMLTSHIEETGQYFFDEVTTDTLTEATLANFTSEADFGWDFNDSGEIDDIDDFHGTTIADTGRSGLVYNVSPIRTKEKVYLDVLSEAVNNPIRLTLGWAMVDSTTLPPSSLLLAYWMAIQTPPLPPKRRAVFLFAFGIVCGFTYS